LERSRDILTARGAHLEEACRRGPGRAALPAVHHAALVAEASTEGGLRALAAQLAHPLRGDELEIELGGLVHGFRSARPRALACSDGSFGHASSIAQFAHRVARWRMECAKRATMALSGARASCQAKAMTNGRGAMLAAALLFVGCGNGTEQ